jgi:GNAT superfamily N-acetyltransferase
MTPPLSIREASSKDGGAIALLLGELGYPASPSAVVERLARLRAFPNAVAFVADLDGRPVGLVTVHAFPSIHSAENVALLTTVVVEVSHTRRSIGRRLVAAAEEWARELGAARLTVTSGLHRTGAHVFYERLGFERTGVRLTKSLVESNRAESTAHRGGERPRR